jgi:hypothetical protein
MLKCQIQYKNLDNCKYFHNLPPLFTVNHSDLSDILLQKKRKIYKMYSQSLIQQVSTFDLMIFSALQNLFCERN